MTETAANDSQASGRVIVGLTGASGAAYTAELVRRCDADLFLLPTRWGRRVFEEETGAPVETLSPHVRTILDDDDLFSPFASGSNPFEALVVLPCSLTTMGKIAAGIGDTLLTRIAAVALKERRTLILCLREAPLSTISLRNALALSESGAVIFPLSPSFYQKPRTLDDAVGATVERILSLLGRGAAAGFRSGEIA